MLQKKFWGIFVYISILQCQDKLIQDLAGFVLLINNLANKLTTVPIPTPTFKSLQNKSPPLHLLGRGAHWAVD